MRRLLCVASMVLASFACESNSPTEPDPNGGTPGPNANLLLITGSDMGPRFQNLSITRGTAAVTNAEVRVNGTVIPHISDGFYQGQLPGFLNPGDGFTLEVRAGADVVTAAATIPDVPTMTAPVEGGTVTRSTPLTFSWTSASNPSEFLMGIGYNTGGAGAGLSTFVSGSTRSGTVTTSTIAANATNATAYVFAYANGTFAGPAHPDSRLRVRQPSATVNLVLN